MNEFDYIKEYFKPLTNEVGRSLEDDAAVLQYFKNLCSLLPESSKILVDGGIKSIDDIKFINNLNYNGAFIGANFMKMDSPGKELKSLLKGK